MDRHLQTEGIVIRKFDFKEADRIVTLLTPDHGKIDCIAKGARRIKSKFCGRLELFCRIQLNGFQGRDLVTLNEARLFHSFSSEKNLEKHRILFFIAEITHKIIQTHQHIEGVYPLLLETLQHLEETDKTEAILHSYIIKLLTLAGFLSPWNRCATCNTPINLEKPVWLSLTDAHVVCHDCRQAGDRSFAAPLIKWVNFMQHYPLPDTLKVRVSDEEHRAVWGWLQEILGNIFNAPLKSEAFLVG